MACSELKLARAFFTLAMVLVFTAAPRGHHENTVSSASTTCPSLDAIVFKVVANAVQQDIRILASLLRLVFHDCFCHGCDASVLLDGPNSEKLAFPNVNSLRGFEVIEEIKRQTVQACGNTVSCADIIQLAGREGVVRAGGPSWPVSLGRLDSLAPYQSLANTAIPGPRETLDSIFNKFNNVGLTSVNQLVSLSGAHTFGRGHCSIILDRLYNFNGTGNPDPSLNKKYISQLQSMCPKNVNSTIIVDLDPTTPNTFDSYYYSNLQHGLGLFSSDQELYPSSLSLTSFQSSAKQLVDFYASNPATFFQDFQNAMVAMGNIAPPSNSSGEIRLHCNVTNG